MEGVPDSWRTSRWPLDDLGSSCAGRVQCKQGKPRQGWTTPVLKGLTWRPKDAKQARVFRAWYWRREDGHRDNSRDMPRVPPECSVESISTYEWEKTTWSRVQSSLMRFRRTGQSADRPDSKPHSWGAPVRQWEGCCLSNEEN